VRDRLRGLPHERLLWPHALECRRVARIERAAEHKFEDFVCLVDPDA
jgi:hypothetical protein